MRQLSETRAPPSSDTPSPSTRMSTSQTWTHRANRGALSWALADTNHEITPLPRLSGAPQTQHTVISVTSSHDDDTVQTCSAVVVGGGKVRG